MKKIIIDTNGLDNGAQVVYDAAVTILKKISDLEITLIGDTSNINKHTEIQNINFIENTTKLSDPRNIRQSLRENTSMNQAIMDLKEGNYDGVISGGDSGSYMASLTFKSGRIEGISRPVFMPIATGLNKRKTLFMDVGANLEVKSDNLYEWAKLGTAFYKTMFNENFPKVTLLNIGTEDYKGFDFIKEAAELIKNDHSLNYIGFSEPRNLLKGEYDIALIDGYGGNLILKSYEGAIFTFKDAIKESAFKSLRTKIGAWLMKPAFKDVMKKLDYRNVGAAWVLGVQNLALKIHGSSDAKAVYSSIEQMYHAIDKKLAEKLNGWKNV
ncbi:phosphate acyltransferase PlsX [Mycoplasmopsis edwardii]|nr:phosphate acyltransferase PlsX [Mycoplasmopsis edwardii]